MGKRMGAAVVMAGLALAIVSCATTKEDLKLDWPALEQQQKNSEPITLLPEADLFGLRIPLVEVVVTTTNGTASDATVHTSSPKGVFGVNCGNGLAIDTEGNLFIDLPSLLAVDLTGNYDITYYRNRLVKTPDSFRWMPYAQLPAKAVASSAGIYIEFGPTKWGYTVEGNTWKYKPALPLLPNNEMTVGSDTIKIVASLIPIPQEITFKGNTIHYNGKYSVTKQGDTYTIKTDESFPKTYKLYYAENQIVFCQDDKVLKNIVLGSNEITVGGEKVVHYQIAK